MGCLNSEGRFAHWFGNIHLSGPCNRSCYFCIGQHMMALDSENNLNEWPLRGLDEFLERCRARVRTIYLTGTNTDPLLYRHHRSLVARIWDHGFRAGLRTNGVAYDRDVFDLYESASVTICSLDKATNEAMMGGPPSDLPRILLNHPKLDLKVNVVLGPENRTRIEDLLSQLAGLGVRRVNLREPYGQPHVGNPLQYCAESRRQLGMPTYNWRGMHVTYWDVHYCHVESVNLYANGRVSIDYPITRGCSDAGTVQPQSDFPGGRVRMQWLSRGDRDMVTTR
jgi:organic radical activating enzyme